MNIAFVTPEYPPGPSGGIGTATQNLARGLAVSNHEVSVVVVADGQDFIDRGVSVRYVCSKYLPKTGWYKVRRDLQERLRHAVRDDGVEIIEGPDWTGLTAGVRPGAPLVVRCHGSAVYFGSILGERVRPSVRAAEAWSLHGAASVAAVSRFTADRTRSLFRLRGKPQVVHNTLDLEDFSALPPGPDPEVLYLGTVVRKKGILDLCVAFNEVVRRVPEARLVVVGRDTPDRRTGAPSTWTLGWSSLDKPARARTEFVGPVPYEKVVHHLARARLCAFPSYAEACPLTWMEAMASGRVIIGYDTPWAREVVDREVSGRLVALGNAGQLGRAVADLLVRPEELAPMGRTARETAERRFSLDVGVKETLAWYQRVLDRSHAGVRR